MDDETRERFERIVAITEANSNHITALLEIMATQRAEHEKLRNDTLRFMTEHLREWHRWRDSNGGEDQGD